MTNDQQKLTADHISDDAEKRSALEDLLDELLERYLNLLLQYQSHQKELSINLSAVI